MNKILKTYIRNPEIIIFYIALYLVLYLFSLISINNPGYNATMDYIYLIVPKIFLVLIYSIFISMFIGASGIALTNEFSIKRSLGFFKKFKGNLIFILFFVIIYSIILFLFDKLGVELLNYFSSITAAIILGWSNFLVFTLVSIFFIFSFSFYTLLNRSVYSSILSSFVIVRENYLKTLLFPIIYLLLTYLIGFTYYSLVQDLIYYLIVYPLFTLSLVHSFNKWSKK